MKKIWLLILITVFWGIAWLQDLRDMSFGEDDCLEILSWNIEWFPKQGWSTVDSVEQIIEALEEWSGYYVDDEYSGLDYIYKPNVIEVNDIYELYTF